MAPQPPSPSASSVLLPFLGSGRERRGSLASLHSFKGEVNNQVLDDIHTSASRSEALTSFRDYGGDAPRAGPKELVSQGVSGLYDKIWRNFKARPNSPTPKASGGNGSTQKGASATTPGSARIPRAPDSSSVQSNTSGIASPMSSTVSNPSQHDFFSKESTLAASRSSSRQTVGRLKLDGTASRRQTPSLNASECSRKRNGRDSLDDLHLEQPGFVTPEGGLNGTDVGVLDLPLSDRTIAVADDLQRVHGLTTSGERRAGDEALRQAVDESTQDDGPSFPTVRQASMPDHGAERPPLPRFGISHLPGHLPSTTTSSDAGDSGSSRSIQTLVKAGPASGPAPRNNAALQEQTLKPKPLPGSARPVQHASLANVSTQLRRRVLSKHFWMKDENAKDCFNCGQQFSTFRRKHHCRTCGQIFDAQCTSLLPGRPFGQPSSIRLCKPCEAMVNGSDDDSTVFSDDMDDTMPRTPHVRRIAAEDDEIPGPMDGVFDGDTPGIMTPSIGIPASRRNREAKRRSAVIEFDSALLLPRPTSSHSLISLARRPRSASHRRQLSRQQTRVLRGNSEEPGPFHPGPFESRGKKAGLPAFHNDNIIDPDLAPFASDEGTDDDDPPNIFAAISGVNQPSIEERERNGLGAPFSSSVKKSRSRLGTISSVKGNKDEETMDYNVRHAHKLQGPRKQSFGSVAFGRASPKRARSSTILTSGGGSPCQHDPPSVKAAPYSGAPPQKAWHSSPESFRETPLYKAKLVRSSAMKGEDAPPIELNPASLEHARRLLAQLLKDSSVPGAPAWEKALMPILLQCTDDVEPDVQQGDNMDIRHYIKLKKVPGGRPGDTSYVSGIVFSKNIALKSMARSIRLPRIAIVTFAIEYARHKHKPQFMSLEPVIAQEQEYLRSLVGRIVALGPHVLLVQKHVSGSALRLLEEAGITVAHNIKESVLAAVARVTHTAVIRSPNMLAIDPARLGHCGSFEVKTYLHRGARKSYIYLSGCQPELGCTIVLRGSDTGTLRRIKRITEFMCYVAYSLKLETSLMRDEFVSLPSTTHEQLETPKPPNVGLNGQSEAAHSDAPGSLGEIGATQMPDDNELPSKYGQLGWECRAKILSASPFVVFMQPYVLTQLCESETRLTTYSTLRDQYAAADQEGDEGEKSGEGEFSLVKPEDVHAPASKDQPKAVRDYLHAVHEAQLEKTQHTFETQRRLFESFETGAINPFDPFSHQSIVVLYTTLCLKNKGPCIGPEVVGIGFYATANHVEMDFEEDCTLGQFVEDMCLTAHTTCGECTEKVYDHHRQYVHGYGQLSVSIRRQAAKMRGYDKSILMWASCRICEAETTVTPMSSNTWKYSFAKYLELTFWSSPLHPRAGVCQHDIHRDFVRCFGFEDLVIRMQYDAVDIYNVVVPRSTITWKVESDLTIKNDQFSQFLGRLNAFTESIKKRLDSINVDPLDEKKAEEAHELIQDLRQRVDKDHEELRRKLQEKYTLSRYYELIPLNRALRLMDEKALAWDEIFSDFERDYFPSETDIRQLASLQLREMFLESRPAPSGVASEMSDTEDEKGRSRTKLLHHGMTTKDLPRDEAHDVLLSTVEEHRGAVGEAKHDFAGRDHPTADHNMATMVSPGDAQAEFARRQDVKHLDLALPTLPSNETAASLQKAQNDRPGDEGDHVANRASQNERRESSLLERIDKLPQSRRSGAELENESRIPRSTDSKKPAPSRPGVMKRTSSSPGYMLELPDDFDDLKVDRPGYREPKTPEKRPEERGSVSRLANKVGRASISMIPRLKRDEGNNSSVSGVSALAQHFEQMSREFERERMKEKRQRITRNRQSRANPLASSKPVVEVFRNATEAVGEKTVEQARAEAAAKEKRPDRPPHPESATASVAPSITESAASSRQEAKQNRTSMHRKQDSDTEIEGSDLDTSEGWSRDASELVSTEPPTLSSTQVLPNVQPSELDLPSEISIPEHKKTVWFTYLAEFWSKRSASGWTNLEYPLHATEHVFEDSDIIVREDEPSSTIALALASNDYKAKVKEFRSRPRKHTKTPQQGNASTSASAHNADTEEEAFYKCIEASLLSEQSTHLKYGFSHGAVKTSCKIFYPEAFDALRRKCGVGDRFVESLSRCFKFDSKGGRTKSLFLKTLDSRFMIKSLQEVELKAFTKFAPDYFAYMSNTLFHGVPSVIAKLFGVFQVIIKNPATGMDFSYYLLVMENLFYDRTPNRRFDLKGSMRNRKVESTGQPDEVLLDENLVDTIFEKPLFVREHARKLLQASVWNDTLWLCRQNVMDYSLMAGFDDERKEIVVGIIDCIRTYTWDKKLESWIKDRGKNKPTITSPKEYRNRFRGSMGQYVLQVSQSQEWLCGVRYI